MEDKKIQECDAFREAIKQILTDNLEIRLYRDRDSFHDSYIRVELILFDEVISSDYLTF